MCCRFVILAYPKCASGSNPERNLKSLKDPDFEGAFAFFHPQWALLYLSSRLSPSGVSGGNFSQETALARKLSEEAVGYISRLSRRSKCARKSLGAGLLAQRASRTRF